MFRFASIWVLLTIRPPFGGQAQIAKKVDDLDNQFRPAMRAGYIKRTFKKKAVRAGPALGQAALVEEDDKA